MKIKITQTTDTANLSQALTAKLASDVLEILPIDLEKEATYLLQNLENERGFIFLITAESLKKINREQWQLLKQKQEKEELKIVPVLVEATNWFYTPYAADFPIFPATKTPVSMDNLDELVLEIQAFLNGETVSIATAENSPEDTETILAKAELEELKWRQSSIIASEASRKIEQLERLQSEAAILETAQKWSEALEKYKTAITLATDETVLQTLTEKRIHCEKQLSVDGLIAKGKQAYRYNHFDTALDYFKQVYEINGDKKVEETIKKIESRKRNEKIKEKERTKSRSNLYVILGVVGFAVLLLFFVLYLNREKPIGVDADEIAPYQMVLVNGGAFTMGQKGVEGAEPEHEVVLNSFYIGKHEITVEMYDLYTQEMGFPFVKLATSKRGKLAMTKVSWFDAVQFANWLSLREGYNAAYIILGDEVIIDESANGYRLPTEAQWEFAAQGGLKSKKHVYSGSDIPNDVSWNSSNAMGDVHTIQQKKPNELGIYDMSGNVWEWCWDWHDEAAYEYHETNEPQGDTHGKYKVIRGGSWFSQDFYLRIKSRSMDTPHRRDVDLGFRLVRPYDGIQN